jgi:excisionase family DNA binding protein
MQPDATADVCKTSPWLTATQAARYLQRGRRFVLREIHAGRLRAARIGGRGEILTRPEWLDDYVTAQATPVAFRVRVRA